MDNNKAPALPPPDVVEEIGRVLYGRSDISAYLARIAGQERPELRVVKN